VVEVPFPDGTRVALPTLYACRKSEEAEAAVRKDAGDDVDATHGSVVTASLSWAQNGDVTIVAGEGVGTVTRPGLSVPPGEPAVNPVPRGMIRAAIREVTKLPVRLVLSIPGGKALAEKTFNPGSA
jgi:cobalt-precorrin-5B (C1)-methyltransferase